MTMTKRILSVLLSCLMLAGMLSVGVFAAGTQADPIDAATKWFGYGVDTYLLNPTIAAGTTDGIWYTLTANKAGILFLEHKYKDVDYTITITVNGNTYVGGSVDGVIYNGPIMTPPLQVGDVATVQVVTKDAAAGTVYANMNIISGDDSSSIKVKSTGIDVYVGAGETVYFQDDTLNAVYATKGLLITGDVANTTFYTVAKNTESGAMVKKAVTDTDADGVIEAKLGGSLGSAGAPPVKPAWAIENRSGATCCYTLTIVDAAHECVYDDATDASCNSCGAIRELSCQHVYDDKYDVDCNLCGESRFVEFEVLSFSGNSASKDVTGLAFRFQMNAAGITVIQGNQTVYDNATVTPTSTSGALKLVQMGAVVSNDPAAVLTIENANDSTTKNISATYLCNLEPNAAQFAVRVIHIPLSLGKGDALIFARPYYIYEKDGTQTIIYGDTQSATYNTVLNNSN